MGAPSTGIACPGHTGWEECSSQCVSRAIPAAGSEPAESKGALLSQASPAAPDSLYRNTPHTGIQLIAGRNRALRSAWAAFLLRTLPPASSLRCGWKISRLWSLRVMEWFRLEGILGIISSHAPAICREPCASQPWPHTFPFHRHRAPQEGHRQLHFVPRQIPWPLIAAASLPSFAEPLSAAVASVPGSALAPGQPPSPPEHAGPSV